MLILPEILKDREWGNTDCTGRYLESPLYGGGSIESQKNSLDRKGKKDYSLIHRQFYKDLQGRVQFPTGGIAHEPQGMIR